MVGEISLGFTHQSEVKTVFLSRTSDLPRLTKTALFLLTCGHSIATATGSKANTLGLIQSGKEGNLLGLPYFHFRVTLLNCW
jgi:hypothetical protein